MTQSTSALHKSVFSSVSACRRSKVSIRAHTSDPPSPHVSYHSFALGRELPPQKHPAACAPPELLTTPVCARDFLHCLRKTESHGSTKQADQQPTCSVIQAFIFQIVKTCKQNARRLSSKPLLIHLKQEKAVHQDV